MASRPVFTMRIYPEIKIFHPLQIKLELQGGWGSTTTLSTPLHMTELKPLRQENHQANRYNDLIKFEGGIDMRISTKTHHIFTKDMEQKEDWRILLALARKLEAEDIALQGRRQDDGIRTWTGIQARENLLNLQVERRTANTRFL